jgi:histidyl-tRNA synthetase
MKTIEPRLPGGFRDYPPKEAAARARMFQITEEVFKKFNFQILDTSRIERAEVLTGGDSEFDKQIFYIGERNVSDPLALRFDLTVPLARFVAANYSDLPHPFRRYQIGSVWRAEQPQAGRFREFTQCDADIVGASGPTADAEILALACELLKELGLEFTLRINSRPLLNALLGLGGIGELRIPAALRAIDKLEKVGEKEVAEELKELGGDAKKILSWIKASRLEDLPGEVSNLVGELAKTVDLLSAFGVPDSAWRFDLSIARGLGYYTGIVFETTLDEAPEFGSVLSGGRYDGLTSKFGPLNLPAVGMSLGADRLFAAMSKIGKMGEISSDSVVVLNFDLTCTPVSAEITGALRSADLKAELYAGEEKNLGGQINYALKAGARVAIICGGEEAAKGVVQVKDLKERKQKEVPMGEVVAEVRKILTQS